MTSKTIAIPAGWRRSQLEAAKLGQSVDFTEILVGFNGARIRIRIRSDSYVDQSHAIAEFWDGMRWNEVCRIAPAKMATERKLAYRPPGTSHGDPAPFAADRNELLRIACEVIGVEAEQLP